MVQFINSVEWKIIHQLQAISIKFVNLIMISTLALPPIAY